MEMTVLFFRESLKNGKTCFNEESLLIKSQWKIEENIGSGFGHHK
jgi:hypothetical protein